MQNRHILLAVFVALIWGFNFIVIKFGLKEVPPFMLICLRYMAASIPLVFFIKKPPIPLWLLISIGFTLGIAKFSLMYLGIHLGISASIASLVMQTQVFFSLFLSFIFYKTSFRFNQIIGLMIAFIGIVLIGTNIQGTATFQGFIILIGAAFCWGLTNILNKKTGNIDFLALMVWTSLIPPLPMLALSYYFEGPTILLQSFSHISWIGISCVLYTAFMATCVGGALWSKLINLYSPAIVAPYSLLIPFFGFFFAHLWLGESFTLITLFASALIFIGLAINQWPTKKLSISFFFKKSISNKPKHKAAA